MKLLDTSVLLDAFDPAAARHEWATEQIALAVSTDGAAVNPVALAECSVRLDVEAVKQRLRGQGIHLVSLPISASGAAARAFAVYLLRRKSSTPAPRTPLPDFFIGAHAEAEGWTVVTNDAARFRTYFPQVKVVAPSR